VTHRIVPGSHEPRCRIRRRRRRATAWRRHACSVLPGLILQAFDGVIVLDLIHDRLRNGRVEVVERRLVLVACRHRLKHHGAHLVGRLEAPLHTSRRIARIVRVVCGVVPCNRDVDPGSLGQIDRLFVDVPILTIGKISAVARAREGALSAPSRRPDTDTAQISTRSDER
jgi:hypothetical protein